MLRIGKPSFSQHHESHFVQHLEVDTSNLTGSQRTHPMDGRLSLFAGIPIMQIQKVLVSINTLTAGIALLGCRHATVFHDAPLRPGENTLDRLQLPVSPTIVIGSFVSFDLFSRRLGEISGHALASPRGGDACTLRKLIVH
jgi:hypothetical protein